MKLDVLHKSTCRTIGVQSLNSLLLKVPTVRVGSSGGILEVAVSNLGRDTDYPY
jgi:hypothetical protein